MVRLFVWRDVSGTVGGGGSNGRWTVVSSDIVPLLSFTAGAAAAILTHRGGIQHNGSAVLVVIGHVNDRGFNICKLSQKKTRIERTCIPKVWNIYITRT